MDSGTALPHAPYAQAPVPAYPQAQPPSNPPPQQSPPPPGYPPQGYYAQPQGYYAQPQGYYPPPPGYYPAGYAPPAYYAPPDHTASTMAGVMWILCLVRDLLYLIAIVVIGGIAGALTFGIGAIVLVLAIFPLIGIVGSLLAMTSDFQRKNHGMGTVGAVLALIGSAFPGIIVIGPVGLILAIVGLVLHYQARKEFVAG